MFQGAATPHHFVTVMKCVALMQEKSGAVDAGRAGCRRHEAGLIDGVGDDVTNGLIARTWCTE